MKKVNYFAWVLAIMTLSSASFGATNQKSFTPTKYKYPIMEIDLLKADQTDTQILYKCSGATPADCLVNMADSTDAGYAAITKAAQSVSIKVGTYTQVKLWNCLANTPGTLTTTMIVQGTVSVGSGPTTMVTSATGVIPGTVPADTTITWGCGGPLATLPKALVVTEGSTQSLSLLVDLTNAVWTDPTATAGMGGCFAGTGGAQGICGAIPAIVPFIGTGVATFERYLIAHATSSSAAAALTAANANAEVNLAVDPNGVVFYSSVQPYFSETSPSAASLTNGGPDYNTNTRILSVNADGSIAFQTGGSAGDNRVGFTAFKRASDNVGASTCKNELPASATWNYSSFKQ